MSVWKKKEKRDVIPRWRHSRDIATFVDATNPKMVKPSAIKTGIERPPLEVLADFSSSKKPLVWAEALSSALANRDFDDAITIINSKKSLDLSRFALLQEVSDPAFVDRLRSAQIKDRSGVPTGIEDSKQGIAQLRKAREAIRVYDSNALAWLDLARAYAINGDLDRSERGIWTALHFDSNNRWIVRSAARFFIHREKADAAVRVIEQAAGYRNDPWLVSAHIAVSHASGKTSHLVRRAKTLFEDDNFRPKHLSELGIALATLENEASFGSRIINKLAKRSLRDPTENAVAQAEWIESVGGKALGASDAAQRVRNAFEARSKELEKAMEWQAAANEIFHWLCDQPFSSRPAIDGSYIAATFLQDYELAEKFAKVGYQANPEDPLIRNNYAVALAERGDLAKARRVFGALGDPGGKGFEETYRATEGLLRYREGRIEAARECYEKSRAAFENSEDVRSTLLSLVFQTSEELRLENYDDAANLLKQGEDIAKSTQNRDLLAVLQRIRAELERQASSRAHRPKGQ